MSTSVRKHKAVAVAVPATILAAVVLASCGSLPQPVAAVVTQGAQAGELTDLQACEYPPDGGEGAYDAECGTLVVPENRGKADSRLIALPVVRIRASGSDPAAPVFLVDGGPGQSNVTWEMLPWLIERHDVVMVGYRGVDGSVKLVCPELGRSLKEHLGRDYGSDQAYEEYTAATRLCADAHVEAGVDLSSYSIPGVIEDMESARMALGYDRINVLSRSFGTRVAQVYAYLHPDSLHRVVQISVNTPGYFIGDRYVLDKMIRRMSELCAADASCSSRTSDLARTMYEVNRNMPGRWLFFRIDPDTVRLGVHYQFLNNANMPAVFEAYLAAAEGDYSGMAMANLLTRILTPIDQFVYGDTFSKGGTAEMNDYGGIDSINLGDSIMGMPMSEWGWPMATSWPVELIPEDLRELQGTDVEMLLVNGTLDFATPPDSMQAATPYFHKAQMVLLPEFSHNYDVMELQPEAFERLTTSFYDTGVGDDSLFVYQSLSFEPGMRLTVMAKVLAAVVVVLPALLILIAVLVVRRVRRRRAIAG